MHRYSEEQKEFIIANNYGKYSKELAEMFNQHFNTNITDKEIAYFRRNNKLNSGLTNQFKKGNKPKNYRPIGSERITKAGYIEVKVADPNKWETKNKIIYKQYYGDIPKGHKVIYADGNKLNNDINNLILVSNSEELIMNRYKLRTENIELTKTGCLIAKVIDKTNMVKNERL